MSFYSPNLDFCIKHSFDACFYPYCPIHLSVQNVHQLPLLHDCKKSSQPFVPEMSLTVFYLVVLPRLQARWARTGASSGSTPRTATRSSPQHSQLQFSFICVQFTRQDMVLVLLVAKRLFLSICPFFILIISFKCPSHLLIRYYRFSTIQQYLKIDIYLNILSSI